MRLNLLLRAVFCTLALSMPWFVSAATIVYDNTALAITNGSGNQLYYPSASEYGDEITLTLPNTSAPRVLSEFDFYYYYSGPSVQSNVTATIRFYQNDGPADAPGTLFFTSDPIPLIPGYVLESRALNTASNLVAPGKFTWTVQFSNLGAYQAGLLVYGPPTVGSSYDDFWLNTGGTWTTYRISGAPSDFASRFGASVQVALPTVVYDNTAAAITNGSGNQLYYPSTSEYGDEITLDTNSTARVLSRFDFYYYYSGPSVQSNVTATIRFYDNDGPGDAPGTLFFTSDPIPLRPGYVLETLQFDTASNLVAPGTFTWTVQFSNLGANQAGLLVYGLPTVGSSFDDFWVNTSGAWTTYRIGGEPSDFAGRFGATVQVVPLNLDSLSLTGGNVTFSVSGGTPPYQVQLRTNFTGGAWVDFGAPFTNSPVTFPAPGGNQGFFRVLSH